MENSRNTWVFKQDYIKPYLAFARPLNATSVKPRSLALLGHVLKCIIQILTGFFTGDGASRILLEQPASSSVIVYDETLYLKQIYQNLFVFGLVWFPRKLCSI